MKRGFTIIACICFIAGHVMGQSDSIHQNDKAVLNLYLDCGSCDMDYFKTYFTLVNYVTERASADVHILVTELSTASGGTQYTLHFIGMKSYASMRDTLVFITDAFSSQEIVRSSILNYIELGLVPFLLKTPAKEVLTLIVDDEAYHELVHPGQDKWRNWIFDIYAGGSLSNSRSFKSYSVSSQFAISKVTPEIKIESYNLFGLSEQEYYLYEGDSLLFSSFASQQQWNSSNLFVKSLGDHAGIGGIATYEKDNFTNLDHQLIIGPAFEYNFYSYDLASDKQFRFLYMPYYEYSDYIDSTVNNKLKDNRFIQELRILVMYTEQAYSLNAGAYAITSLTDLSQYSFGADLFFSLTLREQRISLNFSSGLMYCHDQVGLKKETATMEDLLLRQREMKADVSYFFSFGLSFRFGSRNVNTVNPRFQM